ncbi:AraC family transcriptional regulator ligand-binding domain-containing protein [Aquabacterium sp.]|uniref:AraC family transcriptional regulator n=1 Tax=Aquabacterium sp. TaxID=1872578 RepID=UPI0035B2672B
MTNTMQVSGAWTGLLSDWLQESGTAAPQLRARLAAIRADDVVPMSTWRLMLAEAARLRPDIPNLGLQIGQKVEARHVGVLGYLVLASSNLGEALMAYQRYERLFYGLDLAHIETRADTIDICWPPSDQGAIAEQLSMTALITFLRQQLKVSIPLNGLGFIHARPRIAAAEVARFFACPINYGDTATRLSFPTAALAWPLPRPDAGLRQLLNQQAQALLQALPDPDAYDQAVQRLLLRMLPDGQLTAERLARSMGQSVRTLERRLSDRGLSWQALLDRTREQLARQYLQDPHLSLSEIALLLGYSEQSNFARAFKRWTGASPRHFRQSPC